MIIDMNTSFVFINIFLTQIYLHKSPYNPLNFEKGQKRIIFFGMQHNNFSAAINFQKKRSLLFGFTHWWKFSIVIQKETLLWWRFSGCRHFMEFFRIWKKLNIYWNLLKVIPMSLFRKKRFALNFLFRWNTSKFAILYV